MTNDTNCCAERPGADAGGESEHCHHETGRVIDRHRELTCCFCGLSFVGDAVPVEHGPYVPFHPVSQSLRELFTSDVVTDLRELETISTKSPWWTERRLGQFGNGDGMTQHEQVCNNNGEAAFMVAHDGSKEGDANVALAMEARNLVPGLLFILDQLDKDPS